MAKVKSNPTAVIGLGSWIIGGSIQFVFLGGCGHGDQQTTQNPVGSSSSAIQSTGPYKENRTVINTAPVAEFREKTDNPLNDWYFSVRLFETPRTFDYLLQMQFEELKGQDTIRLPNLGTAPQPVLKKGDEPYSCIIGFLDRSGKFMAYKKVYVKEGRTMKLTTLFQYSVSETPDQ